MIRFYPNEEFREIQVAGNRKRRYAISNMGRLMSFNEDMKDGILIKGGLADGYRILRLDNWTNGVKTTQYYMLYKLVAEFFVPKTADDQEYVIHLDFSRDNDKASNLKWVNYEGKMEHYKKSPQCSGRQKENHCPQHQGRWQKTYRNHSNPSEKNAFGSEPENQNPHPGETIRGE